MLRIPSILKTLFRRAHSQPEQVIHVSPDRIQKSLEMRRALEERQSILRNDPLSLIHELAPTSSSGYENYYIVNPPEGGWKELWILENTKDLIVFVSYSDIDKDIREKLGIKIDEKTADEVLKIQTEEYHHLVSELKKPFNFQRGIPKVKHDSWRFIPAVV